VAVVSVVAADRSRAPTAAVLAAANVASTWFGSTKVTLVVVTPAPETVILTPLEKLVPVMRTD
jgi:predicted P-loop ATPase/GTPase